VGGVATLYSHQRLALFLSSVGIVILGVAFDIAHPALEEGDKAVLRRPDRIAGVYAGSAVFAFLITTSSNTIPGWKAHAQILVIIFVSAV